MQMIVTSMSKYSFEMGELDLTSARIRLGAIKKILKNKNQCMMRQLFSCPFGAFITRNF